MGNRAYVIFADNVDNQYTRNISPAIYLHWNGGPESVYAFLGELKRRKACGDPSFSAARFTQVVGDYFDQDEAGSLSIGITNGPSGITTYYMAEYARGADDNGVYVCSWDNNDWKVRRFVSLGYKKGTLELPPSQVNEERERALKHKYADPDEGILAYLTKARPKIKEHG